MMSSSDSFLPKLESLIDRNLAAPSLSVEIICREMGISRSGLHRQLKRTDQLIRHPVHSPIPAGKSQIPARNHRIAQRRNCQTGRDSQPPEFQQVLYRSLCRQPHRYRKLQSEPGFSVPEPTETASIAEPNPVFPQSVSPTAPVPANRSGRRYLIPVLMLAVLLSLSLYGWLQLGKKPDETKPPTEFDNSIAILPFRNLGTPEMQIDGECAPDDGDGLMPTASRCPIPCKMTRPGFFKGGSRVAPWS